MNTNSCSLTLLLVSEFDLPSGDAVWGTGGWLPPEQREALDWLTFGRLLGWQVAVLRPSTPNLIRALSTSGHRVVIAGNPDALREETIAGLASWLSVESGLVVARAGLSGAAFAKLAGTALKPDRVNGRSLRWSGPGAKQEWLCRNPLESNTLELSPEGSIWSTLDSVPIIGARRAGRGTVAALGFHPSGVRDSNGAATALLRRLLVWGSGKATAWLDLERTLVLRMDDPGSAENVYHHIYSHAKLTERDWEALGADLKHREGRLSIGYVSGWVDDGDAARGTLRVSGRTTKRVPGKVHPSPLVHYESLASSERTIVHDGVAEFRGIAALRESGCADVELHGYTHMHPNTMSWSKAPDRYESVRWYRELGSGAAATITARPLAQHPLVRGLAAFRRFFKTRPTTLICPGEEWTNSVLECALKLDLYLVGSYYLALRDGDRFCWTQHVCAPYLDKPDPLWFDSGLPVVGYFHDFDISRHGVEWFNRWLDAWQSAGADRIIDFRELAAALNHRLDVHECDGEFHLTVNQSGPPLVRPLVISIKSGDEPLPSEISLHFDDRHISLPVAARPDDIGIVRAPLSQ
jgi:hypothetical protein